MEGFVEDVTYEINQRGGPCHIAINNSSSEHDKFLHYSTDVRLCDFAVKCRMADIPVKIIGADVDSDHQRIYRIGFANTGSKDRGFNWS